MGKNFNLAESNGRTKFKGIGDSGNAVVTEARPAKIKSPGRVYLEQLRSLPRMHADCNLFI